MIILSNRQPHHFGKPFTPDIEVIATALSNINRFTGHVGGYSVAQHCVLMSVRVPRAWAFSALLHDAPEAYIGDVSAPLKRLLPEYAKLEDFYHDVIDAHYDVRTRHQAVKDADLRMLVTEAQRFGLPLEYFPAVDPFPCLTAQGDWAIWPAEVARVRFLRQFDMLNGRYRP